MGDPRRSGARTPNVGIDRGALARATLLAASVGLALALPARAQSPGPPSCRTPLLLSAPGTDAVRVNQTGRLCAHPSLPDGASQPGSGKETGAGRVFAASLLVPGSGQWMQGQDRAYLYLGAELLAWGGFVQGRLEGGDLRSRYRDLAWRVARSAEGRRHVDGDFGYFEAMAQYSSSGAWDRDPGRAGLQPETDPETYNGRIWSLAREIYSLPPDPGRADSATYERALAYYRDHGYPPEMAWDWSGRPGAAERYRKLIDRSDEAYRRATVVLAVIVTNHVLSAVDGFLSARIASGDAAETTAFVTRPDPRSTRRWHLELRLGGIP